MEASTLAWSDALKDCLCECDLSYWQKLGRMWGERERERNCINLSRGKEWFCRKLAVHLSHKIYWHSSEERKRWGGCHSIHTHVKLQNVLVICFPCGTPHGIAAPQIHTLIPSMLAHTVTPWAVCTCRYSRCDHVPDYLNLEYVWFDWSTARDVYDTGHILKSTYDIRDLTVGWVCEPLCRKQTLWWNKRHHIFNKVRAWKCLQTAASIKDLRGCAVKLNETEIEKQNRGSLEFAKWENVSYLEMWDYSRVFKELMN